MPPHTVVIPFGVPDEGRGLGLGLAALVHTFAYVDGEGVAIAQLHARKKDESPGARPSPVEAFVAPASWDDLARRGDAPPRVEVVLTGAIDPPIDGHGTIALLAFDPRDGQTRARVDAPLDAAGAGASLVGALEALWSRLGGEIGALGGLRELEWDSLESVLRAERCALHDPLRGGPHDRLAAMLHLGRAIGDAPEARYPVERLAAMALETAAVNPLDPRLAAAAARALERAGDDAPGHVELVEALSALLLRLGRPRDAERHLNAALAAAPRRSRLHLLLAQCLRATGSLDAALDAVLAGEREATGDVGLATERGAVLAARGDLDGAREAWLGALASDPVHPAPFVHLGALTLRTGDAATAQRLVDAALVAAAPQPDVLRRSIQLVLSTEAEGLARASRVARLCVRLLERVPSDLGASLALARAQVALGDSATARARLVAIEAAAPGSAAAAEAQTARMVLDDPLLGSQLGALVRAAETGPIDALGEVAARARRLATMQGVWVAWVAAATAERRRGQWSAARSALEAALELAPSAVAAHVEMTELLLAGNDAVGAIARARQILALDGESPRTLRLLARAQQQAARPVDPRAGGWGAVARAAWHKLAGKRER